MAPESDICRFKMHIDKELHENRENSMGPESLLKSAEVLILHPGRFFEKMPGSCGMGFPVVFLSICGVLHSLLSSLFLGQRLIPYGPISFSNAMIGALVLAILLYSTSMLLCRGKFRFRTVFHITAYSHVVLLAAWIPGLAMVTGLWKYYLIGLGMVKIGPISGLLAFILILVSAVVLVCLIQLAQFVLG